ncbi:MAG TPA: TIGR02996 domain-containing protein [Gemmataceae bacterium]|jgi:uncharacterized protein (TIGR02996 family)|nr:TIGR02996 domain-containing protein [Gemmataceae bacterium]
MLHSANDRAFVATIIESPDDDAPRLIYADWLDEQGEADRAEFIRLQVREARMTADDPELPGVHARAEYLGRIHHVEWASRLPQFNGVHWEVFKRGFFAAARFDHPDQFFGHIAEVGAAAPIQELRLHQFNHPQAPALANTQQLRSIRVLDLNDGNKIANVGTEALMESRYLGRLNVLKLGRNSLGSAGVRAIAMASYARNIKFLRVERNDLFDEGLHYVAESHALVHLSQLDMERTRTGDDGVMTLARTKLLKGLSVLNLSHNQVTDEGLIALAKSPAMTDVLDLFLSGNAITDVGIAALAGSPHLARLERVFLRQNRIGDDGAAALIRSPHLSQLRELHLGENRISDRAGDELRSRFRSRVNLH